MHNLSPMSMNINLDNLPKGIPLEHVVIEKQFIYT